MIIKLFKELGRRMDKQSEKLEILTNVKNLDKLENVKKKKKRTQTELKKSILEEINRILDGTEGQFRVGKQGRGNH